MQNSRIPPGGEARNPLAGFALYLLSILLSAAVILYLVYHFTMSFGSELTTELALQITESDSISVDAYVVRRETVLTSQTAGGIGCLFSDGDKVKANSIVANIYSGVQSELDEVLAIDREIELLEASGLTEGMTASDTSAIDNRIASFYYTIRQAAENESYSNLPKRRDELLTLLNKRQILTGATEGYGSVIENLQSAKDALTSRMETVSASVETPVSGYFYSVCDGYETLFTPDMLDLLSLASFDALTSARAVTHPGNVVGKIATEFDWYIIGETTRENLRYFNEAGRYTVIFPYNNDKQLEMELSDILIEGDRALLVLHCTRVPEDFSFRRMQPIEIIRSSHTGYKVPISAVRLVDGVQGVYILVGNTVEFRRIDVELEMDGYYIVTPQDPANDPEYKSKLALYDAVITGGRNLYVGKIIS